MFTRLQMRGVCLPGRFVCYFKGKDGFFGIADTVCTVKSAQHSARLRHCRADVKYQTCFRTKSGKRQTSDRNSAFSLAFSAAFYRKPITPFKRIFRYAGVFLPLLPAEFCGDTVLFVCAVPDRERLFRAVIRHGCAECIEQIFPVLCREI